MSSYLAEVLSSVEEVEIDQINLKCPEVAAAVESCKTEVLSYLDNIYVRFSKRPRQNKALAGKMAQLQDEISGLISNVQQITRKETSKAEIELEARLDSLGRIGVAITLVATVYNIHEALMKVSELQRTQSYLECMRTIRETENSISNLKPDENLPIIKELSLNLITEKSALLSTLSNISKDNIMTQLLKNKSSLKVSNGNADIKEVLSALYFFQSSVTPLDDITKFLWDHIFVPVVDYTTEVSVNSNSEYTTLEVITVDPEKKSSYVEVFNNIKAILSFLMTNFNIDLSEDMSILRYIGRDIRDNLSELIIKHCLEDTIPSTEEALKEYNVVIEDTEDLQRNLVLSTILAEDSTSLSEYVRNIDVHFVNKKCQKYTIEALSLMRKDLHDTLEVGEEENSTKLEITSVFPRCSISRSVVEILKLLERLLSEASTSSDVCAERLFTTARDICQQYILYVPRHHKKLLQTIPQQMALFYNNCMYISHILSEWNDAHLKQMPSALGVPCRSFGDEGRQLREVASERFASFVSSQIAQIQEIMKESDITTRRQTLERVDAATEKCLRQCLRQQELLKTVWQKVLPYSVYNKTLGVILDALCQYLVQSVVRLEDISSDAAEELVELFKMVQTRGPKLFTDAKEVSLFVAGWYKFNELAFVLNASLLDINDRWADGKGPLGLHFKAEELRQLVRALFQNTEKRGALLAKIHD